ncbi:UTP--glucose-1-phosphate uridylyltransferase GalU [Neisseriaceae bacterium ESL0693]|nr:UTP--glucose-1-phosphate uridylyltransferase GalU [Neisseriaceae bacterium ESL0693]
MSTLIHKCVFPVAGLGTRFLPATKASPKEMLPVVDKPLIQYAVEEAVEAGCTELIFITGRNKRSIEDHFDKAYELETELAYRNQNKLLDFVQDILPSNVTCLYIRQSEALGLGHAVLCARAAVGREPFALILADDLIDAPVGALSQMMQVFQQTGHNVVGVESVALQHMSEYGMVEVETVDQYDYVRRIIEKPQQKEVSSSLGVVGRYILHASIFDFLMNLPRGVHNNIQLSDAIARLLRQQPVIAYALEGRRYDCGNKLGYLEATIAYGLKHPQVGNDFASLLRQMVSDLD